LNDGTVSQTEEHITEAAISNSSAKIFPSGTLLIALYGATVGKLGVLKIDAATNQAVCAIFTKGNIERDFLFYYLLKQRERLVERRTGGAQPNISQEIIRELEVPFPPLPEQQRIAEVLFKADRLRRLRRTARELSDTYLQSVFLEMFGDPVSNPMGWEIKGVGSQIRSIRYGTGSPPLYQEEGIPFIRATNIKGGTVQTEGLVHISKDAAKEIAKCKVSAGDLILVRSGVNTGDCALIPPEYDGAYAAYDLIIEVSYPQNYYYNFIINSGYGKSIIQPLSRRAGQPHINAEQVKSLQFPSPPTSLQKEFAQVAQRFERLRVQQREAERQSEHLFQTLLHRAFRGEM